MTARVVDLHELLEDIRLPLGVYADPGVDDVDADSRIPSPQPDEHAAGARVADCIVDQVADRAFEQGRVGGSPQPRRRQPEVESRVRRLSACTRRRADAASPPRRQARCALPAPRRTGRCREWRSAGCSVRRATSASCRGWPWPSRRRRPAARPPPSAGPATARAGGGRGSPSRGTSIWLCWRARPRSWLRQSRPLCACGP